MPSSRHPHVLVCALVLAACAEDVPITTEPDREYIEFVHTTALSQDLVTDLVVVLEPTERAAALPIVRERVRQLATGDADGDGVADHYAEPVLRVTALTPEDLRARARQDPEYPQYWLPTCWLSPPCFTDTPSARYRFEPYGFAPPVDHLLTDVDCLLSDDARACERLDEPDAQPWRTLDDGILIAVTLQDLAEMSPLDFSAFIRGETVVDFGPWSPGAFGGFDRVALGDDGLSLCEVRETLPSLGPITTCDQLANFGRSFDRIDDAGHEVCLIQQLPPNTTTQDDYGFYYYSGDVPSVAGLRPAPSATPQFPPPGGLLVGEGPRVLMNDNTPFVMPAFVEIRCSLTTLVN